MRVAILGVGNVLLSDDAVGIHTVRALADEAAAEGIETAEAEIAGFSLLELLEGRDAVVVVDAVRLEGLASGEVVTFDVLERPAGALHLVSGHQIDVPAALELGAMTGLAMPRTVTVVGVQIEDDRTFSESMTPAVADAVTRAARTALECARRLARGEA